jgi:hypothetical protein
MYQKHNPELNKLQKEKMKTKQDQNNQDEFHSRI